MRCPRSLFVVAATALSACAVPTASPEEGAPQGGVDGDRSTESISGSIPVGSVVRTTAALNFRRSPSTTAAILDVIPLGATATVTETYPQTGFYHLEWSGVTGWSSGTYLKIVSTPSTGGGGTSGGGSSGTPGTKTPTPWTCTSSYATSPTTSSSYGLTAFGCWVDASGVRHGDSGDNCLPGCLAQAKSSGLCSSGDTGKACEERVTWYVADAGRFGCLARVKITNPKNGLSVVAVALDYGPACWVEKKVARGVLDASGRVNRYLFGSDMGVTDGATVTVEAAPSDAVLGPS
jgi:hypothetical protein